MIEHSTMKRLAATRPLDCERTGEILDEVERSAMLARILATPRVADTESPIVHSHKRRNVIVASAAAVTVAAGLVGAGLAVSQNSTGSRSPSFASSASIKAHLLSAIDATNEIIETSTTWPNGASHVDWSNAGGTINHFIQTGWPETLSTVTSSGRTFVAMYPASKTWMTYSSPSVETGGGMVGVNDLRAAVQSGRLSVIASNVEVDGQNTTEYLLTDPPLPSSADSDLWVNSSTGLPVRETAASGSPAGETTWTYYDPTSDAASNLAMPIPDGYTQVPVPANAIIPPGGQLPIKIWNGTKHITGGATCPPGGPSCLVYPRTLPLPSSTGASGNTGTSGTTGVVSAP